MNRRFRKQRFNGKIKFSWFLCSFTQTLKIKKIIIKAKDFLNIVQILYV